MTTGTLRDHLDRQDVAFLAGSGVSVDAPSALPTGEFFIREILSQLGADDEVCKRLINESSSPRLFAYRGVPLRFEMLVQILTEHCDPALGFLRRIAAEQRPNLLHRLLLTATPQPVVLTTNFDSLFESAAQALRLPVKTVSTDQDYLDLMHCLPVASPLVCKLHGSLGFEHGQVLPDTALVATISGFGKAGYGFSLRPALRKVVHSVVGQRKLVVVGYSGLDTFDVLPLLEGVSDLNVIWLDHWDGTPAVVSENGPSDHAAVARLRTRHRCIHVRGRTAEFLGGSLSGQDLSLPERPAQESSDSGSFTELLRHWSVEHLAAAGKRSLLLAFLALAVKDVQLAQHLFRQAAESRDIKELDRAKALDAVGCLAHEEGASIEDCLKAFKDAGELYERLGRPELQTHTELNVAALHHRAGDLERAWKHYSESLEKPCLEVDVGSTLYQMAIIKNRLGDSEAALKLSLAARRWAQRVGDLATVAHASGMIGDKLASQKLTDSKNYVWEAANMVVALYGYQPTILTSLAQTLRQAELFSHAARLTALWVREAVRRCADRDCIDGLAQIGEDLRSTGEERFVRLGTALEYLSAGLVLSSPELADMRKNLEDTLVSDPPLLQALRTTEADGEGHEGLKGLRSTVLEVLAHLPPEETSFATP